MRFIITYLILGLACSLAAQPDSLPIAVQRMVAAPGAVDFSIDASGNTYAMDADGTIIKYDSQGQKRAQFSQNRLGTLQTVITQNPLKVLAWYADFRTVVILDRNLAPLGGVLNLVEQGYPEVYAVAPAADGNIWAFDEVGFRLRKLGAEGKQVLESQDLNLLLDQRLSVRQIVDNGEYVIAADTAQGLLIFDVFGQFQSLLPIRDLVLPLTLDGSRVQWIARDGTLRQVNLQFPAVIQTWQLPAQIRLAKQRYLLPDGVAIAQGDRVEIWK